MRELHIFIFCITCISFFIECCTVTSIVHFALSFRHLATMYFYHYVYCLFIRICFIALCNICMSENSSVELRPKKI